jgi:hypothetical protein
MGLRWPSGTAPGQTQTAALTNDRSRRASWRRRSDFRFGLADSESGSAATQTRVGDEPAVLPATRRRLVAFQLGGDVVGVVDACSRARATVRVLAGGPRHGALSKRIGRPERVARLRNLRADVLIANVAAPVRMEPSVNRGRGLPLLVRTSSPASIDADFCFWPEVLADRVAAGRRGRLGAVARNGRVGRCRRVYPARALPSLRERLLRGAIEWLASLAARQQAQCGARVAAGKAPIRSGVASGGSVS